MEIRIECFDRQFRFARPAKYIAISLYLDRLIAGAGRHPLPVVVVRDIVYDVLVVCAYFRGIQHNNKNTPTIVNPGYTVLWCLKN